MQKHDLTVGPDDAGQRIDQFLSSHVDASRSRLQRLIRNSHIRLNGQPCRKKDCVSAGDTVTIDWPEEKPLTLDAEDIPLPVVYEDDDLIVINKPAGMVVHPAAGNRDGTLVNALLGYDYQQFQAMMDEDERPGIVHRLDKDTSGLIVVARNADAKTKLSASFEQREVSKTYLAIIQRRLPQTQLRCEAPIARHPVHRKKMTVSEQGRSAVSIFAELAHSASGALVQAQILTGRTHQIRVHLQHLGCPILGDDVYGGKAGVLAERQMLHAWKLGIAHPRTQEELEFIASPPEDFLTVLRNSNLQPPSN